MNESAITQYIAQTFAGVEVVHPETSGGPEIARGDTFFIYDPNRDLESEHRFPFATIVTKDYAGFDEASNLNRAGVFRLNIGVGRDTFRSLFGEVKAAAAVDALDTGRDFSVLDQLIPHPVYGAQSWVSVLNPSEMTFEKIVKPLLAEAYRVVVKRHSKAGRE